MITLKDVNKKLKDLGLKYVKRGTDMWDMGGTILTDMYGKRIKGFNGGSVGPMTATSAYDKVNRKKQEEVANAFIKMGGYVDYAENIPGQRLVVGINFGKKTRVWRFIWVTYVLGGDDRYEDYRLVVSSIKDHKTVIV